MLVDTSVWIDFLNGHESAAAVRLTRAIADGESIALTGPILTEVLLGLKDSATAQKVAYLLDAFAMLPELDRAGYEEASALYRHCRAQGYTIRSTIDCLIAQICLRDGLPLLTKDRDFVAIAQCSALRLVQAAEA